MSSLVVYVFRFGTNDVFNAKPRGSCGIILKQIIRSRTGNILITNVECKVIEYHY